MENTNDIVSSTQPPFDTSSGGSLDKETLTSYQKKIYNNALLYASKNNDPSPKDFALKTATSTSVSHGKNNPFGDLASKTEPGTIKNGIKYRNYPTVTVPLSKQYDRYLQEQNNAVIEQNVEQQVLDNNFKQTQQLPEDQSVQLEQTVTPSQGQPVNIPQTSSIQQPQSIYDRNYSDQQIQSNNPSQQLEVTNPIKQFAMGGNINETSQNELNSYNVGGYHSQNPLGGIPQGIGSNGKQNTVEEGESSYKIDGKKFIFSNRIFL